MADFTVCTSVSCLIGLFDQRIWSAWRLHLPLFATLYFIRVWHGSSFSHNSSRCSQTMTIIPESDRLFLLSRTYLCFNSTSLLPSGLISYNLDQNPPPPFKWTFICRFWLRENPYIIFYGYCSCLFENNYVDNSENHLLLINYNSFYCWIHQRIIINLIACFVLMIGKCLRKINI